MCSTSGQSVPCISIYTCMYPQQQAISYPPTSVYYLICSTVAVQTLKEFNVTASYNTHVCNNDGTTNHDGNIWLQQCNLLITVSSLGYRTHAHTFTFTLEATINFTCSASSEVTAISTMIHRCCCRCHFVCVQVSLLPFVSLQSLTYLFWHILVSLLWQLLSSSRSVLKLFHVVANFYHCISYV